jgi:undecaprenyl-diphosphatase
MVMTMISLMKSIPNSRKLTAAVCLASLLAFALLGLLRGQFSALDSAVNAWAASIHGPLFNPVALAIHYGLDTIPLTVISLLFAGYLYYRKHVDDSLLFMGSMLGNAGIIYFAKFVVHSPRPLTTIIAEDGFSFPSGHVMSILVLLGLIAYFAWKHSKSKAVRTATFAIFAAAPIIVAFSRVYLNVHWLSDVVASYPLAIFWLSLSLLVFQFLSGKPAKR